MKVIPTLLAASCFALYCFAAETSKPATAAEPSSPKAAPLAGASKESPAIQAKVDQMKGMSAKVADATLSAPFTLKDEAVSQASETELAHAGKAVFKIVIPADGDYLVYGVVNAPAEDANSFYVAFDQTPEDPLMIWDIEVTKDFEVRPVSWRGNGDANNDEFTPKTFKLTKGEHQLIVLGREPGTFLKRVLVRPAKP